MNKNTLNIVKSFTLGFSFIFLFLTIDGAFSIQSLIIPFAILFVINCLSKTAFTKRNIIFTLLFLLVYSLGNLYTYFSDPQVLSEKSFIRILTSLGCVVFFLLMTSNDKEFYSTKKNIRYMLLSQIIVGVLVSTSLIIQRVLGAEGKLGITSFFGVDVDPNIVGGLVVLSLCINTYFLFYDRHKILYLITFIIQLFGAFFTGSRSILVGYLAFVGVAIIVYLFKKKSVKAFIAVSVLVLFIVGFFFLAKYILPPYFYDRFFGNYIDASNIDRLKLWSLGFKGFIKQPIFGYGPGNYNFYILIEWPNHLNVVSHNSYIDILTDTGIFGLIAIFLLFFDSIKKLCKDKTVEILPFLATFVVITIIISAIRTWLFWYNIGLVCLIIEYFNVNKEKSFASLFDSSELEYEVDKSTISKVACVTVLYNPTDENLENILTYEKFVDKIYLMDNSTKKNNEINKYLSDKVVYVPMNGNVGLSIALNKGSKLAYQDGYKYLMTMDQDSSFPSDFDFESYVCKITSNEKIALISPSYSIDRKAKVKKENEVKSVLWTMQSASIFNLDILDELGYFENKYFIDMIDYEYCLRVKKANYLTCVDKNSVLNHSPGETKKTWFGYKYGYCSPVRIYYQIRNSYYTFKKFKNIKVAIIICYKYLKILLFFDNKKEYFRMFKKARQDYKANITGPYKA